MVVGGLSKGGLIFQQAGSGLFTWYSPSFRYSKRSNPKGQNISSLCLLTSVDNLLAPTSYMDNPESRGRETDTAFGWLEKNLWPFLLSVTIYTHSKTNHIQTIKRVSVNWKRTEITQSPFFGHNRIKLEISNSRMLGGKTPKMWILKHNPYQVWRRQTGICLYFSSSLSSLNFSTRMAKIWKVCQQNGYLFSLAQTFATFAHFSLQIF